MRYAERLCYCGWAYDGKKCRELQRKYPELKKPHWHYDVNAAKEPNDAR